MNSNIKYTVVLLFLYLTWYRPYIMSGFLLIIFLSIAFISVPITIRIKKLNDDRRNKIFEILKGIVNDSLIGRVDIEKIKLMFNNLYYD